MKEDRNKEKISLLLDAEMNVKKAGEFLDTVPPSELAETAGLYLLIGDVLRNKDDFLTPSADLGQRIRDRLKSERYVQVELEEKTETALSRRLEIDV